MSRSNPGLTNPAQRYFKWSGSRGELVYYDKEKQEEIPVKLPFTFLVLDQLSTMVGWNDQEQSAYWSNEVRNTGKEELAVRTKHGTATTALYKDLGDVKSRGAKYAKSVYIAFDKDDEQEIGNFKASGAALTAWIEFCNLHDVLKGKVALTGSESAKKGATTYFVPTFEMQVADKAENEGAIELDKQLQTYLGQSLSAASYNRTNTEPEYTDADAPLGEEIPIEETPF